MISQKQKKLIKIFGLILGLAVLVAACCFCQIIFLLSGYYTTHPIVPVSMWVIFIVLGFLLYTFIFSRPMFRKSLKYTLSIVVLGFIIITVTEVRQYMLNRVPYLPSAKEKASIKFDNASLRLDQKPLPRLDGATAFFPVYDSFVNSVYPDGYRDRDEALAVVRYSRTSEAYRNLIDGYTDIIFVLGPSDEQMKNAENSGVTLNFTPIGKDAFVFVVNKNNPIKGLHSEDVVSIYSGKVKNWKEVGGKNIKIKPYQRPKNSGSQTALENFMAKHGGVIEKPSVEYVAQAMGGVIRTVAHYRNFDEALGYSFRFYVTDILNESGVKLLEIDGVAPSKENIGNGTYPLTVTFYAVTASYTKETLASIDSKGEKMFPPVASVDSVNKFLKWITSAQGQSVIDTLGYLPVNGF